MRIYLLEANGRTNTGEYVKNISNAIKMLSPKVFTSVNNVHKEASIEAFYNYGSTKRLVKKLSYYFLGWLRILLYFLTKSNKDSNIFHTHWFRFSPVDFIFLFMIKVFTNTKHIHTVHNLLPHEKRFYDNYFHKKIYKNSDVLIFHNETNKIDFISHFKLKKKFKIIPHYSYVPQSAKTKEIEKSILFFGNIRRYKNLELFLESVADLEGAHVTVAGTPEYDISMLKNEYAQIHWKLGWVSDEEMHQLFSMHQLVVLPYLKIDNSGLIHLAMSYGKAVIASDLPMFKEIIGKNQRGLLFESNNLSDLRDKIKILLANYKLREKLGNSARELMQTKHSLNEIGNELKSIYSSIN